MVGVSFASMSINQVLEEPDQDEPGWAKICEVVSLGPLRDAVFIFAFPLIQTVWSHRLRESLWPVQKKAGIADI